MLFLPTSCYRLLQRHFEKIVVAFSFSKRCLKGSLEKDREKIMFHTHTGLLKTVGCAQAEKRTCAIFTWIQRNELSIFNLLYIGKYQFKKGKGIKSKGSYYKLQTGP